MLQNICISNKMLFFEISTQQIIKIVSTKMVQPFLKANVNITVFIVFYCMFD